jgi:polyhydroxyalkanoate synthesis regulator phasin
LADPQDIELGRLLVARGLLTQEQALALVRECNAEQRGLSELVVVRGFASQQVVDRLRELTDGETRSPVARRADASTEHEISLTTVREQVARACLEEALAALPSDRSGAFRELRRLATEFSDTESGNRAAHHLRAQGETV